MGRPVQPAELTREVAAATVGGIRSPIAGYPADGLNPLRLASILRDADQGEPLRYFELAETIEERDAHYLGVLGTRRRSVAQIEMTVEAHSDAPEDVRRADMVRAWLDRDELAEEIFDILDCIGKGVSFTEITWERSEGQWMPARLDWRDPRWFRFDRRDLTTPVMLGEGGEELPLPGFKFITASIKAKSGLPLRAGLARVAAWGWMFKAYSQRDWAIFTQTYGQPLRLGKFGAGATEDDKNTLFRAVANIAGDCAAIIPESMQIEFVETGSVGATSDLYKTRCDWLDQQISKAVLGQTATTDAVTGGLGSGTEHRQVQEDIERADARALQAILNRDLIRPWMQLNFGALPGYPRLVIARPEQQDLTKLATALAPMIDRGLRVEQSAVRDRFGFEDPADDAEIMGAKPPPALPGAGEALPSDPTSPIKGVSDEIKRVEPDPGISAAPQAEGLSRGKKRGSGAEPSPADLMAARLAAEARPAMAAMLARIEAMVEAAGSLEELREMLLQGFPDLEEPGEALTAVLGRALVAAELAGRVAVEEETEE